MIENNSKVRSVVDANGNEITNQNHIANLNPIRYRGYYLDLDTGLYYLQQRYYDPETGRFINADNVAGNTGNSTYNLFVYCSNDPVNGVDPTGNKTYSFDAVINALWTFGSVSIFGYSSTYYRVELTYTDGNGKQQTRSTAVSSDTRITAAERDRLLALIPKKQKSKTTRTQGDVVGDEVAFWAVTAVVGIAFAGYAASVGMAWGTSTLIGLGAGFTNTVAKVVIYPTIPEGTYSVFSENTVHYDKQRDQIYFKQTVSWVRHGDTNYEHSYSNELWFDLY